MQHDDQGQEHQAVSTAASSREPLMTAVQLAEYLSVSVSTVRRLTRAGEIPCLRVRGLLRYQAAAVVEVLMERGIRG